MKAYPVRIQVAPAPETLDDPAAGWFDEPTGLPGPAFWHSVLAAESARCARYRCSATVLVAELVGLDEAADRWGQEAARRATNVVGVVLRAGCRDSDYVARLSEHRFGVLLTETNEIAAINMVERVRGQCERMLAASTGIRVAFGWASPVGLGSLVDATDRADERVRREVGSAKSRASGGPWPAP